MNLSTKADLISTTAKKSGLPESVCKDAVFELLSEIKSQLCQGKTIELREFGTFKSQLRKPCPARSPRTGETVPLGYRYVAKCKVSPAIANRVKV